MTGDDKQAYQLAHQTTACEVALQECDEVSPWQEDASSEDSNGGLNSDSLVEGVETGCGQDEASYVRYKGQGEDCE